LGVCPACYELNTRIIKRKLAHWVYEVGKDVTSQILGRRKVTRIRQLYTYSIQPASAVKGENEDDKNIESKGNKKDVETAKDTWKDDISR